MDISVGYLGVDIEDTYRWQRGSTFKLPTGWHLQGRSAQSRRWGFAQAFPDPDNHQRGTLGRRLLPFRPVLDCIGISFGRCQRRIPLHGNMTMHKPDAQTSPQGTILDDRLCQKFKTHAGWSAWPGFMVRVLRRIMPLIIST